MGGLDAELRLRESAVILICEGERERSVSIRPDGERPSLLRVQCKRRGKLGERLCRPGRSVMRVAICQPRVAKYRVPVFERLGGIPGIELSVFAGKSSNILEGVESGANFRFVPAPVINRRMGPVEYRYQAAQIQVVKSGRFDAVILPWDSHYLSLGPAILAGRLCGVPVLLWGHGYSKKGMGFRDSLRNFYGKRANAVLLYSQTVAQRLVRESRFQGERVFVAQNAIDQAAIQAARDTWSRETARLASFRREHELDPQFTVAFVSRLLPDNRIELLVEAFALVRREQPNAKLVIIGDGPCRRDLESLALRLHLGNSVIFAGAIFDENNIAPWLLSSTVFVYPRNIGLSLMHAFGYGLPVITSDNLASHNPEIEALVAGENGLLYEDGNVEDMARKILTVFRIPNLRASMAEKALRQVHEVYTVERMVDGFLEILDFAKHCRKKKNEI